eukprot:CAMPEP_0113939022 /NCGR_PEP_ID=MMETSP1339-20121228/5420_1 /TAXON_ID=94617 /ORGANISM="Fibrocapsa japonica" /LENGTH=226 /DNA_ID=CAMNT_0000942405 /DNA_START=137 /DNA_END=817 /DNA_ORIENTATION=+ /assembly_acc=CAM_ASM_000762
MQVAPTPLPKDDNAYEKVALFSLSFALAVLCDKPFQALKEVGGQYSDFVRVTRLFLSNRSPNDVKMKLVGLLSVVIPPPVKKFFREKYAEDPKFITDNSVLWFTFGFLTWLVGPTESFDKASAIADEAQPMKEEWQNGIILSNCRFLSEGGCKGMCVHLCKTPTQTFFKEQLGVPLYMEPNFETGSCSLQFGVEPPDHDPAFGTPCFTSCNLGYTHQDSASKEQCT